MVTGAPVEIEETPRLTVGGVGGDTLHSFHRVRTPFLLPGGHLAVPLNGASTIRVFGADGRFVTGYGRPGEGPGEFRYLVAAWARADTVEALDSDLRRITRFLPDGRTETIPLETRLLDLSIAGSLGEGWAVAGVVDGGRGRRDRIAVRRVGPDGSDLGAITGVDGMFRYGVRNSFIAPAPLSPTAFVVMAYDLLYAGESLTPEIQVFDPSGALLRELGWEPDRATNPREVFRAVVDSAVRRTAPSERASVRRRLERASAPDALSVYWKLVVDQEGFVWIRPYEPFAHAFALGRPVTGGTAAPGGRWRILTSRGVEVGPVRVPPDLELVQVTANAVVGIVRDEFGVESVRVHALRRR